MFKYNVQAEFLLQKPYLTYKWKANVKNLFLLS